MSLNDAKYHGKYRVFTTFALQVKFECKQSFTNRRHNIIITNYKICYLLQSLHCNNEVLILRHILYINSYKTGWSLAKTLEVLNIERLIYKTRQVFWLKHCIFIKNQSFVLNVCLIWSSKYCFSQYSQNDNWNLEVWLFWKPNSVWICCQNVTDDQIRFIVTEIYSFQHWN